MAGAGNTRPGGHFDKPNMSANEKTLKSLADALETIAKVLKEAASSPVPSSPEAASVGMCCTVDEYGSVKDVAARFHYSVSGITPYLEKGVREGAIKRFGGQLQPGGRRSDYRYNMRQVEQFLLKNGK